MAYRDKEEQRKKNKLYYEANKVKALEWAKVNNRKTILKKREYIREYLKTHCCIDCKETDPIVLEFDHIRGEKLCDIAAIKWSRHSVKKLEEEIAKCEIRCANCHRRRTYYVQHPDEAPR
jgi:hypothetical protein